MSDVQHKLVAIGSRSTESANKFIEKLKALDEPYAWGVKNGVMDEVKGYGSYDEVYNAPVSTPSACSIPYTRLIDRTLMRSISGHLITSIMRMPKVH